MVSDDDFKSSQLITPFVFEFYFKSFQFVILMFGFSQSELVSIDVNNSAKEFRERPSKVSTKQFKKVSFESFFFYSLNDMILQLTDNTLTIIEEFL